MMKILISILIALMVQVKAGPNDPEKICLEIENVALDEALTILRQRSPDIENQNNQNLKCYAACILEKINVLDGCSYQLELGLKHAMDRRNNDLSDALKKCKDSSKGNERCDCGYNVFKCITDNLIDSAKQGDN